MLTYPTGSLRSKTKVIFHQHFLHVQVKSRIGNQNLAYDKKQKLFFNKMFCVQVESRLDNQQVAPDPIYKFFFTDNRYILM